MFSLTFMYPKDAEKPFNVGHFLNVHLPMGLFLTKKHMGIEPTNLVVLAPTLDVEGADGSARYGALSTCFFKTKEEALRFSQLFTIEEAARLLSEDFPKYTAGPPAVLIAEVIRLDDVPAMIAQWAASARS